ncbi:MAG TPA: ABC transporter permease [Vicinamibacterales bacterium]|nr:ABC transporter permease [Vicinamibacterales bacterium]
MELLATVHLALRAIGRHRLRSALTLLGITIGVAVVIVMVAIGTGAQRSIEQQVRAAGANLVTVTAGNYSPGNLDPSSGDVVETGELAGGASMSASTAAHKSTSGGGWAGMSVSPRVAGRGASTRLSTDDSAAIARDVAGVRAVAPGVSESAVIWNGRQSVFGRLHGTDATLPAMRALAMRTGRFFDGREVATRAATIVLTPAVADRLFGDGTDPTGSTVRIRQAEFTVAGVTAKSAGLSTGGAALDEVYAPYTTVQQMLDVPHLQSVAVSVDRAGESTRIAMEVTRLLRARHALGPADPDDFIVRTQARDAINGKGVNPLLARAVAGSVVNLDEVTLAEIASSLERSSRTMTALLASVASVSLLVGGIGIMNIMLVSVTERTREIGLRMALGARGRDVLVQFLVEAITLSLLGGLAGVVIGIAGSSGVGRMLRWATVVSPSSVALSVAVAGLVGIFFGFYPARQASRLDPIDALRFE